MLLLPLTIAMLQLLASKINNRTQANGRISLTISLKGYNTRPLQHALNVQEKRLAPLTQRQYYAKRLALDSSAMLSIRAVALKLHQYTSVRFTVYCRLLPTRSYFNELHYASFLSRKQSQSPSPREC